MWNPTLYAAPTSIAYLGQDDKGRFVRLAETIFHPQGGGQPFDVGSLKKANGEEVLVVGVQKELDPSNPLQQIQNTFEIKHYIKNEDISLELGECVDMTIDVSRRKLNARLHSAGHLIAASVNRQFSNLIATSGHHIPGEARVDFKLVTYEEPGIASYKSRVAEFLPRDLALQIATGAPVHILRSEETGRSIQIGDFDAVPCGGTHVENLEELAAVEIRSIKPQKDLLRVSYTVSTT
jgi:Ser-tRNA(Ala) deacylase AlaX